MRPVKSMIAGAAALLATVALPACGQPAPQAQPAPTATAANDADPALWVVKDSDTTIYLFGTVHVLKPGLTWFDEAVKTAFDGSQQLVLEMVEPDPATMQKLVLAKGVNAGGPTLTEQLPADKRAQYGKALSDLGLPAAAFDRFKPWFAAVNLTLIPIVKAGYDPANGPEKILTAAAAGSGKSVSGLETAEQQLSYFDGLSQGAQVQFLTSTLDELPKTSETMATMVGDWAAGNPDALARLLNENLKDSPEVATKLLVNRNANWATWIAERMKQPGQVFVAVGAGHLAGEQSVIAMLGKHRLTAERVKY